jgi:CRISPR-associated protein Cmr4
MKTLNIKAYSIECLTNLHVGSGSDNFGIVDKEIQRDQVDNVPIIHASSMKGAIREFFEECTGINVTLIKKYFGSDKNDSTLQQGLLRFFEGRLLAIPVRGIDDTSDYLSTSEKLISDFNGFAGNMNSTIDALILPSISNQNAKTEYGNVTLIDYISNIGNNIAYFPSDILNKAIKSLPIIARNSLENGQSENLWYEEVIPRGSKFYFL